MKKNIKVIVIVSILAIVLSISLAYFSYYRVGTNHEVVAGDVYMELENGNDTMNMTNVFPETVEEARDATKHTGDKNNIISFTVSGKNDTNKDIYYEILLNKGTDVQDKTRFLDEHLVFDLVEIDGENRRMLADAVSFEYLNETKIWVDVVKRGTTSYINRQYELRMWLSDAVTFGEGPGIDYTSEVFANSYASVKVSVRADMEKKSYPLTYTLEPTLNNFSLYLKNDYVDDDEGQATNDTVRLKVSSDDDNIRFNYSYVIVTLGATEDDEDIETLVLYTDQSSIDETFNYTINEVKNISMKVKNSNLKGSDITFEVIKNGVLVQKFIKRVYKSQTDINIMDVFPSGITDNKASITKVEFKNVSQSTLDSDYEIVENGNVYDLTLNDGELHGDVRGKLDNDILTIVSVGKTYLNTGYNLFSGFTGVTEFDFTNIDTSLVSNMYAMFYKCSGLTSIDLSNFNTSKVTNMMSMFMKCSSLTSLDVSSFNTSSVTTMYAMFDQCSSLTSLDVSNFNTSEVTNMRSMFLKCSSLTSLDLSSFNTSKVTTMLGMFRNCTYLTTIYVSDLWNVSSVTSYSDMFKDSKRLLGGARTIYNSSYVDKTYARIDGKDGLKGYLTSKDLYLIKETYLEQDLTTWTATNVSIDSNGVATFSKSSSKLESSYIPVNGAYYYVSFDGYGTNILSGKTNPSATLFYYFYNSSFNAVNSLVGKTSDGRAASIGYNQWKNGIELKNISVDYQKLGLDVKYVKISFQNITGYSSYPYYIRNVRVYGEMSNSFYLIAPRMGDDREITTIKYDSGVHDLAYFANNGIVSSESKIRVTENGDYTVYVEDINGHAYVGTVTIDNIV